MGICPQGSSLFSLLFRHVHPSLQFLMQDNMSECSFPQVCLCHKHLLNNLRICTLERMPYDQTRNRSNTLINLPVWWFRICLKYGLLSLIHKDGCSLQNDETREDQATAMSTDLLLTPATLRDMSCLKNLRFREQNQALTCAIRQCIEPYTQIS